MWGALYAHAKSERAILNQNVTDAVNQRILQQNYFLGLVVYLATNFGCRMTTRQHIELVW
jgi:hypothetical protein